MEQPRLEVTEVPVASLVPYAGNAKQHPSEQVDQIAASIREFGNCDPIAVWTNADGDPEIVEGHGRLLALQRLGIETAPVIRLDHLTDEQRRAYTHVHNQTTLNSGFDLDALAADIADLPEFDWQELGFDIMAEQVDIPPEADDIPDSVPKRVERGQVWALGEHRLMCGDSTKIDDVLKLVDGGAVSLLLTDPPYNVDYHSSAGSIANDNFRCETAFREFLADALTNANEVMEAGAAFYVWYASVHSPAVYGAIGDSGLIAKQELEWVKGHFTLGRQDYQWAHEPCIYGWKGGAAHYFAPVRNETTVIDDSVNTRKMSKAELREMLDTVLSQGIETTVLRFPKPVVSDLHPTTKPVKLFAKLISNSSRRGDKILDLFGGSGTTVIAAENLRRKAFAMELDPHYCDVIIQRWEDFTGGKAVEVVKP